MVACGVIKSGCVKESREEQLECEDEPATAGLPVAQDVFGLSANYEENCHKARVN